MVGHFCFAHLLDRTVFDVLGGIFYRGNPGPKEIRIKTHDDHGLNESIRRDYSIAETTLVGLEHSRTRYRIIHDQFRVRECQFEICDGLFGRRAHQGICYDAHPALRRELRHNLLIYCFPTWSFCAPTLRLVNFSISCAVRSIDAAVVIQAEYGSLGTCTCPTLG